MSNTKETHDPPASKINARLAAVGDRLGKHPMYAAAPNPKRENECRNPLLCAASNNFGLKMSSVFVI